MKVDLIMDQLTANCVIIFMVVIMKSSLARSIRLQDRLVALTHLMRSSHSMMLNVALQKKRSNSTDGQGFH